MDLEDMTAAEVFRHMDQLMYAKHEFSWIDPSLKWLSGDFIRRIEEHFTPFEGQAPLLENYPHWAIIPLLLKRFKPSTRKTTLNPPILQSERPIY